MSTDLTLSKAQISKINQSGGFVGSLLSKLAGPYMKVVVPLPKNILAPLEITIPVSAIDVGIQNNTCFWSSFFLPSANNNFNNFKQRNEWHNENCSSSWRF